MGMMSGTSADGIDAAIVPASPARRRPTTPSWKRIITSGSRPNVREQILRLANGGPTTTAEVSRLDFVLGEEFARAAIATLASFQNPPQRNFSHRLSRPDHFSPGLSRTAYRCLAGRFRLANWRARRHRRTHRCTGYG